MGPNMATSKCPKKIDPICWHIIGVTASAGAPVAEHWTMAAALYRARLIVRFRFSSTSPA
jgi:hypothetical protein